MSRNQGPHAEFRAIECGASEWALRRARLCDRHGDEAVDAVLAVEAAEARVAMARQEVSRLRWTLGKPGLSLAWRRRTETNLTEAGARLQRALTVRLALDRRPSRSSDAPRANPAAPPFKEFRHGLSGP